MSNSGHRTNVHKQGRLVILEGPDGVGKSALAKVLHRELQDFGERPHLFSSPGKKKGTLGNHIYNLHHSPQAFGIEEILPVSLQLLHVAAHIDSLQRDISPVLDAGGTVILDRFWWSTWVYGIVSEVSRDALAVMIDIEQIYWHDYRPLFVCLIAPEQPRIVPECRQRYRQLRTEYLALAEQSRYPVFKTDNTGTLGDEARAILDHVLRNTSPC